jgi:triphosphatase
MIEIELKFHLASTVSAPQIEALDWSPYVLGPRSTLDQRDTFFDSRDLALGRSRHAVRLREGGATPLVTLKGPGVVRDGVHQREELELATMSRAPQGWPESIRERIARLIGAEALHPIFAIENHRRVWPLVRDGVTLGEIALDEGRIIVGDQQQPLHELEIELKGGTPDDLATIRRLVERALPARPENRSKFARGLALLRPDLVATAHESVDAPPNKE